jgi:hypothetical protein
VRALLLVGITRVRREGMIEGLAIDILGVRRKVRLHRSGQIALKAYGMAVTPPTRPGHRVLLKKAAAEISQAA